MYTIEWCKVYCSEDGKTHTLSSKVLEPEDSDVLKVSDIFKGNTLLWKLKGKKYTTQVLETYGNTNCIILPVLAISVPVLC